MPDDEVTTKSPFPGGKFTDKAWDGSASRFTTEQYIRACAWVADKPASELTKSDAKLPHHEPDGTVNVAGLRAALAAAGGARTGQAMTGIPGAREHLERHWAAAKKRKLVEAADDEVAIRFADGDAVLFAGADGATDWVEIFRAGKYPQGAVPEQAVAEIAASYDEGLQAAPISVDHAKDGPAFGWVSRLRAVAGRLYARFRDVVPEFREVARQAYPRRSVELYPPKASPTGGWYLKGVSFLGVRAPAVKGMASLPASFADDEDFVAADYEEWKPMADKDTKGDDQATKLEEANARIKELEEKLKAAEDGASDDEIKELREQLAEFKKANTELATKVAKETATRFLAEERGFCDALQRDGKLVPSLAAGLPEFLVCLREQGQLVDPATIEFGEGEEKKKLKLYQFMRDFLAQLGKLVELGEIVPREEGDGEAPPGVPKGSPDADLHAKALAWQKDHEGASYAEALIAVAPK